MNYIRKHAALPALVIAFAMVIGIGVHTYGMKDDATFYLKDLTGTRDAIGDVRIGGELADGYQRTQFSLSAGKLNTATATYAQPHTKDAYTYNPGTAKRIGDMQFNVSGVGTYSITSYKRDPSGSYFIPFGTAEVTPTISNGKTNSATYTNQPEYGVAKIGDKVYFTVPVSTEFTGKSGIFELHFFAWGFGPGVDRSQYTPRKIAEIDLDANRSEQPHLEVLGLEAVGDKLLLLSVADNQLKVSSYDSESGDLLGETSVSDFHLPERPTKKSESEATYYENYSAFADADQKMLTVAFRSSGGPRLLLIFDVSRGVRLVESFQADFGKTAQENGDIAVMSYRNGKLYALRSFREARTADAIPVYDLALTQHLYLYVYSKSELVYQGELVTDLNEDNMDMVYGTPVTGGFSYDPMDYRSFAKLTVTSLSSPEEDNRA
ncbi:hypothetical protein [Cohnella sp. REN36]|uniref:hypothetical protein n=1 Tax=Cohnella sp. REN36 TaxID=2887347 RepID=UPI001D148A5B|nr:hypothetical protein [Cohnella sp. REN36]MCC3375209.1 hypothetical protein [Cohnella sp. REN36]